MITDLMQEIINDIKNNPHNDSYQFKVYDGWIDDDDYYKVYQDGRDGRENISYILEHRKELTEELRPIIGSCTIELTGACCNVIIVEKVIEPIFKIKCLKTVKINNHTLYEKGKIYTFIDGQCETESGGVSQAYKCAEGFLKTNSYFELYE